MNQEILSKLITDPTALQLYTWLCLHQEGGRVSFNCSDVAKELNQKRPTIYKALQKIIKLLSSSSLGSSTVAQRTITVVFTVQDKQTDINAVGSSTVAHSVARKENERKEKESNKEKENKAKEINTYSLRSYTMPRENQEIQNKKDNISQPSKHPYAEIIAYCREKQGIREQFVNYVKQTVAVKRILSSGYSIDDLRFVIDEMASEDYWKANTFDLMNVANNMHKYMNRTVMYNQSKKGGKYAYN